MIDHRTPPRTPRLLDRPWSRTGAVAAVLAAGVPRRVLGATSRIVLLVGGSITIGLAVGLMFWNDFGPGPFDVFVGAVRNRTGLPLSIALWSVVGVLALVAWGLGRRPGPGTLIGPLIIGPVVQATDATLTSWATPGPFVAQVALHLLAVGLLGLGAGAMIASGLGAGTGELVAAAASDRSGRPEPRVRAAFESTWLVLGVVLGGPFGFGTVMVALLIGPAVARGHRIVDVAVSTMRPTTIEAAPAALARPLPSPSTLHPISAASSTLDSRNAAT